MSIQNSNIAEPLAADANVAVGERGTDQQSAPSPVAEEVRPAQPSTPTIASTATDAVTGVEPVVDPRRAANGASQVTVISPGSADKSASPKKKQAKKEKAAAVADASQADGASQVTDGPSAPADQRALLNKEKEGKKRKAASASAAATADADVKAQESTDPAIENFKAFDPFLDAQDLSSEATTEQKKIELRVQQRNNRKCITTITNIPEQFNLKKILKTLKKKLNCNGTIVDLSKMEQGGVGFVIQLSGDQRDEAIKFLQSEDEGLGIDPDIIWRHGF